jgi:hypothetical protein
VYANVILSNGRQLKYTLRYSVFSGLLCSSSWQDFIADDPVNSHLPKFKKLQSFAEILFQRCALLIPLKDKLDILFNDFCIYRYQIPVCGCILVNPVSKDLRTFCSIVLYCFSSELICVPRACVLGPYCVCVSMVWCGVSMVWCGVSMVWCGVVSVCRSGRTWYWCGTGPAIVGE